MKRIHTAFSCCLVVLLLSFVFCPHAFADETTEIRTPEELADMVRNPSGSYILMEDLDMAGRDWEPFDFSGTLDGNGHAILNLTVTRPGTSTAPVLDGNQISYDACFAGLFGQLDHAVIQNLKLLNLRGYVVTDAPCFLGGVAGFSDDAVVSGCDISGILELRAHNGMFGIAGGLGYGTGDITDCKLDVTLICVDTDPDTLDEQFLGGGFGTGFMTVSNCDIQLDGYISEFGYVHSGGITGMSLQYPIGMHRESHLEYDTVTGKITFFEKNSNRRAYCDATIGEKLLSWNIYDRYNTLDFKRDERKVYDVELRPETCEVPAYQETVHPATAEDYGYTEYTCQGCGYTFTDCYTLKAR